MSTDIAVRATSDLAIDPGQTMWTDKQRAALVQLGVKDASNADLAVFFHQATRTGLDPFAKQIYMIGRNEKQGDKWVTKQTIQTGIDGFRLIARRAVDRSRETLGYSEPMWCGPDGQWRDAWLADEPPAAAKVTVYRNGQPFPATAHYREYVQTVQDKQNGGRKPNSMWERMPANQIRKCAEAAALRMAFPQELSGLYTDDETAHVDNPPDAPRRVTAAEIRREAPPEVIEGQVEPAEPVRATAERVEEPITPKMLTALNAALTQDLHLKDRDDKLAYLSGELGREIASSRDVTKAEAMRLLDGFARTRAEVAGSDAPDPDEPPADHAGEQVER